MSFIAPAASRELRQASFPVTKLPAGSSPLVKRLRRMPSATGLSSISVDFAVSVGIAFADGRICAALSVYLLWIPRAVMLSLFVFRPTWESRSPIASIGLRLRFHAVQLAQAYAL
jgi:hypothetical protein